MSILSPPTPPTDCPTRNPYCSTWTLIRRQAIIWKVVEAKLIYLVTKDSRSRTRILATEIHYNLNTHLKTTVIVLTSILKRITQIIWWLLHWKFVSRLSILYQIDLMVGLWKYGWWTYRKLLWYCVCSNKEGGGACYVVLASLLPWVCEKFFFLSRKSMLGSLICRNSEAHTQSFVIEYGYKSLFRTKKLKPKTLSQNSKNSSALIPLGLEKTFH